MLELSHLAVRGGAGHVSRPVRLVSEEVPVGEPGQAGGGDGGGGVGEGVGVHHVVEGGGVQGGGDPLHSLSLARPGQELDYLAGRRDTVVRQILWQKLAEEGLEVGVDGEGSLPGLGGAALVDVVGHEKVEGLHQLGDGERVPVLELVTSQVEPLLRRPCT